MTGFKDHTPSCDCGSLCDYTFVPTVCHVTLKDGPSGSWPSKGERFKRFRRQASESAAKRQRDRYGPVGGAVPNYKGEQTESWTEAKEMALKESGPASAATYDQKIASEKKD